MRIFIATQTFLPKIGGMQILMSSIANGLSKLNYNVHVFPDHYFSKKGLSYQVSNTLSPKLIRSLIKKIKLSFKSNENDIFICDSWKSVFAVPQNRKIICFVLAQELLVRKRKEKRIQKAFDRCKFVIPISTYTKSLINSKWIVRKNKIKVINPTFPVQPKGPIKKRGLNKTLIIFSICRIEKRKGLYQVAKSLIRQKGSLPKFIWHIAGEGDAKSELLETIKNSNIKNNVVFEGLINERDKDHIFRKTDLFIMPSYKELGSLEGFGITYTEASSYGIPSISGIEGGVTDAVKKSHTGWCVDPNNENEIDDVIFESFNNHTKRLKFGKNALEFYEKNHTDEIAFKNLTKLF